ncbi:ATP-dependent DNA helicase [Ruminococcaceae bacterium OttesenSCG-928-L11]|nr:ATP-dependent DNA helicase [Ruminococcaceae bacterium OttesenSCG-928-L11]
MHPHEIITSIPPEIIERYRNGLTPVFLAYGCVLLEGFTGIAYVYKAVNLATGKRAHLCQLRARLTTSCYGQMADRVRWCDVSDTGRMEIDARLGKRVSRDKLSSIQTTIFEEFLPSHGYSVRTQQMELAAHILDALCRRDISLAEAEVGSGKTLAYLIAAAMVKRGRYNDDWVKQNHLPYIAAMPVVIATSSIALQKAIVRDYIPQLSCILMEHGVINTPLTCVLRKGREHFLCEKRLRTFLRFECDPDTKEHLASLLDKRSGIDLGEMEGITPYIKSRIGVAGRCDPTCPQYRRCRYLAYLQDAQSDQYDFQICNHQYLLADILRRRDDGSPLIPDYQAVVIDEAHKFLPPARQMYGIELSCREIAAITDDIRNFVFRQGESGNKVWRAAKRLAEQSERLFSLLAEGIPADPDDETDRFAAAMDEQVTRHLCRIQHFCETLVRELSEVHVLVRYKGRYAQVLWELARIRERASALEQHSELICWIELARQSGDELTLHAIPKNLDECLHRDLWSKGLPIILTSGTLSAAGNFGRIKRSLGLHRLPPSRLMETSKPSPFDYYNNTLLYISEAVPFPDSKNRDYIVAVADEVERLIHASHGHAAVLFTSYNAMGQVYAILKQRGIPFPLFRLDRGGTGAIDRFKQSGNGVLFASGAMWEGIDIPGDALSMLILVKLPFAAPDPISDYERTLHPNGEAYRDRVLMPEMLVRYKQGHGRGVRTETDTCVFAMLDFRLRLGAAYRAPVLAALPACRVTSNISDIPTFLREKKSEEYFR